MKNKTTLTVILVAAIIILALSIIMLSLKMQTNKMPDNTDEPISFLIPCAPQMQQNNFEMEVKIALIMNNVQHPEIVYAQAILETGHFKSNVFKNYNNMFGLYDSYNKDYYKFVNWNASIIAYVKYIQYKYEDNENYYAFLTRIGYAKDPDYIDKLKELA